MQYGGTKGFVEQFSRALQAEVCPLGVTVQCQSPLYVTTKLAKIRRASITVPTPKVRAAVQVQALFYMPSNRQCQWLLPCAVQAASF